MTPQIEITVDGKPVSGVFYSRLISIRVTDKEGTRSDTIDLKLDDSHPFAEIPRRGAKISVAMGYRETGVQSMGEFVVDEVELECLPYAINVQGKAADMRETLKAHKNRHWDDMTVKDIVSEIAGDHGLSPAVSDAVGDHNYKWFGQVDESDMSVLDRLAARHDALFTVKDGKLIFAEKGAGKSASGKAVGGFILTPDKIVQGTCKVSMSDRGSFGKVVGYYQDKDDAERKEIEVESDVSDSPAVYRLREAFSSEEEATKAARSKSKNLSRGGLTTAVTALGDTSIRAGGGFAYGNVRPGVDGIPWIIETAEHSFSKSDGYKTAIQGKVKSGDSEKSATAADKTNGTERAAKDKAGAAAVGSGSTGGSGAPADIGGNVISGDGPE
ncbi:contractile injection system protein, VgrG/Pvc8 family [Mesorhizobium sp. M0152]|uniref:phage late control D family protein n=1 Tax=Mesorhizobium sp. M0152 TaxID=2956898 RepID=UPI0033354331